MTIYLGDGAYAQLTVYGDLILTTSNGVMTTNRIVLGSAELKVLLDFLKDKQDATI